MKRIERFVPYEWKCTPMTESDFVCAVLGRQGEGQKIIDVEKTNEALSREISYLLKYCNEKVVGIKVSAHSVKAGYGIIVEVEP